MAKPYEYEYLYQKAAEKTLLLIEEGDFQKVISDVLFHLDNNVEKFYRLVTRMLAKREQWLPRLYLKGALDIDILDKAAQQIITEHLQSLNKTATNYFDQNFFSLISKNTRHEVRQIKKLPSAEISDLEEWKILSDLCLTKSGQWRKKIDKNLGFPAELKEQKKELLMILAELQTDDCLKNQLMELSLLPDAYLEKASNKALRDISEVLKLSVAQLKLLFNELSVQDFSEVGLQAIGALDSREKVSDIALFLDYQINHLLIDEFQDTSYAQLILIEKLLENWQHGSGKTIFLVGDPMQSIYRFRESQVGIFLEVKKNGISNVKINSLLLNKNFRSNKSVVDSNNKFFSRIFPLEDNLIHGAIHYSKSSSASSKVIGDAINFFPYAYKQNHQEAQQVVSIIQQNLALNANQEIAVLVKSRSHLKEIIEYLQLHNIDYEAIKTLPLRSHLFTRDLISLTRAILSLADKLAWLSILRAPWCGLSLKDLVIFSSSDEMTIFHQLEDKALLMKLDKDSKARAAHLHQALSEVIANNGRFSFVERFSFALNQLYPHQELDTQQRDIKSNYLSLLNDCEIKQSLNIETIESMLKDLYAPSQPSNVKLMTIHQAKGLEFDVVILPGLGRAQRNEQAPLIHMKEFLNNGLLLAPIKSAYEIKHSQTFQYLQHIEKRQNHYELMRLLYVAMTRAKQKLHLLGCLTEKGVAPKNTFFELLSPFFQKSIKQLDGSLVKINQQGRSPLLRRYKELTPLQQRSQISINETQGLSVDISPIYQSALGSLVHYYFEKGSFSPTKEHAELRLLESGVPSRLVHSYANEACQLLQNTKKDKLFDWLFKDRESTQVEAEYSNKSSTVIIDRMFIDDDTLWIIDFKTARPMEDEAIGDFIERQKSLHRKQLMKYKDILQGVFNLPTKVALYCPAVSKLVNFG
jgi:ATP-dependent exoDNAse (exonuclease V) beta subunit